MMVAIRNPPHVVEPLLQALSQKSTILVNGTLTETLKHPHFSCSTNPKQLFLPFRGVVKKFSTRSCRRVNKLGIAAMFNVK